MGPIEVIGKFVPEVWDKPHIRRDFIYVLRKSGLDPNMVDVRDPEWFERWDGVKEWHRDTAGIEEDRHLRVYVWASREPTLIRYPAPFVPGHFITFQSEPFEVVSFDNTICSHMTPPVIGEDRWFVRYIRREQSKYTEGPLYGQEDCRQIH